MNAKEAAAIAQAALDVWNQSNFKIVSEYIDTAITNSAKAGDFCLEWAINNHNIKQMILAYYKSKDYDIAINDLSQMLNDKVIGRIG